MSLAKSWQLNVFELKINWKKLEITNRLSRITSKEVRSESYSRVLYKYKQTEHHWIPIHTRTHIHRDRERERERELRATRRDGGDGASPRRVPAATTP